MIARNVHIRTDEHVYSNVNIPIHDQGMVEKDIIIDDDVWIGYGAQIMSGVRIGQGAIVGAGAIVTHDVEPYTVVVGIPAKPLKLR